MWSCCQRHAQNELDAYRSRCQCILFLVEWSWQATHFTVNVSLLLISLRTFFRFVYFMLLVFALNFSYRFGCAHEIFRTIYQTKNKLWKLIVFVDVSKFEIIFCHANLNTIFFSLTTMLPIVEITIEKKKEEKWTHSVNWLSNFCCFESVLFLKAILPMGKMLR